MNRIIIILSLLISLNSFSQIESEYITISRLELKEELTFEKAKIIKLINK